MRGSNIVYQRQHGNLICKRHTSQFTARPPQETRTIYAATASIKAQNPRFLRFLRILNPALSNNPSNPTSVLSMASSKSNHLQVKHVVQPLKTESAMYR
jgi:hypothetical protein